MSPERLAELLTEHASAAPQGHIALALPKVFRGMDGFEVVRELHKRLGHQGLVSRLGKPDVIVLAVTHHDPGVMVAENNLLKPAVQKALIALLKEHARRTRVYLLLKRRLDQLIKGGLVDSDIGEIFTSVTVENDDRQVNLSRLPPKGRGRMTRHAKHAGRRRNL